MLSSLQGLFLKNQLNNLVTEMVTELVEVVEVQKIQPNKLDFFYVIRAFLQISIKICSRAFSYKSSFR
jgi:hypothetical protein